MILPWTISIKLDIPIQNLFVSSENNQTHIGDGNNLPRRKRNVQTHGEYPRSIYQSHGKIQTKLYHPV